MRMLKYLFNLFNRNKYAKGGYVIGPRNKYAKGGYVIGPNNWNDWWWDVGAVHITAQSGTIKYIKNVGTSPITLIPITDTSSAVRISDGMVSVDIE